MSLNNIKRLVVIAIVSACAFVSCVQMEDQNVAVGYLSALSLEVDVVVDDLMQTKDLDFYIKAPEISEIHYVVKDKDGNTKYDAVGLWAEPLVLPVGAYTIEATHGENGFDAPYFKGSFSGTIIVLDRQTPTLSVSLENSLVNVTLDTEFAKHFIGEKVTMDSGTIEKEFGEWFYVPSGSNLTLTLVGKNSAEAESESESKTELEYNLSKPARKTAYSIVCKASSTNWPSIQWTSTPLEDGAFEGGLYFKAAVPSNVSDENASMMKYQIKGGKYADWADVSVENVGDYKYISGLENDTEYRLRARIGNIFTETELPFTPVTFQSCFSMGSVTAAHNNAGNADVELSSTTMTANNMQVNLPSIVAELATVNASGSFASTDAENKAAGSFSDVELSSTTKNVPFTNASGWPYLPQGKYSATVEATCSLNGKTYTATATATPAPEVPAPVFKVVLNAYTSYDKATGNNGNTKDITAANNCNPTTLYGISGGAKISVTLLENQNYGTKSFSITLNDGSTDKSLYAFEDTKFGTNTVTLDNQTGLSWQAYTLTASMKFDGVTLSTVNTHHITGLPYDSPNFLSTGITMKSTSNAAVTDWVSNGDVSHWSGRGYRIIYYYLGGVDAGNIFSPAFQVPESTNIKYSTPVCYFTTGLGNPTMDAYTGVTTDYSKVTTATTPITRVNSDDDPGIGKFTTISKDDTLVYNGRISISTDEQKDGNAAQNWFTVASLSVDYR